MADDLWLHNFNDHTTTRLFNNTAQDIQPMWIGNKVYFISDRDRTMNLFSYSFDNKAIDKLTDFTDYDIKYPGHDKKTHHFSSRPENFILTTLPPEK